MTQQSHPDTIAAIDAALAHNPATSQPRDPNQTTVRTYLDERDRAKLEARAATAEGERDALLRTNQQLAARLRHADAEHGEALADLTAVWTALNTAGMTGPSSAAELVTRLAAQRDAERAIAIEWSTRAGQADQQRIMIQRELDGLRADHDSAVRSLQEYAVQTAKLRDTIATLRQIDRDATQLRADLDAGRVSDRLGEPAPVDRRVEYGVRFHWDDGRTEDQPRESVHDAEQTVALHARMRQESPGWRATAEVIRRTIAIGSWEPAAASVPSARAQEAIELRRRLRQAGQEQAAQEAPDAHLGEPVGYEIIATRLHADQRGQLVSGTAVVASAVSDAPTLGQAVDELRRAIGAAGTESIRPADWEQHATDAIQAALADEWSMLATDPTSARRLAQTAVSAVIDAGLAGAGGHCRQCGDAYPRTLPAGQDRLCWTCDSEEQTGPFQAEG